MQWGNYREALTTFDFTRYLRNSAFVTIMTIGGTLFSSATAAFGFSRYELRGRNVVFGALLSTIMLPAQVTIIPLFAIYSKLGWINTFYPLIVPAWLGLNVFAIFLLRQFFLTIPKDYVEAALIDGASEPAILANVFLPLAKPALLTVAVFTFIWTWNDLWNPVIFLHDEKLFTMPIGLVNFIAVKGVFAEPPWHLIMAVSTVMVIPVVIVFFLAQKRFIEGINATGLKA